jgi:hypothetical protein
MGIALIFGLALLAPGPLERWSVSADIPLTPAAAFLQDHVPGEDRGNGPVAMPIAGIPDAADLVAFDATLAQLLLCVDVPISLAAGAVSRPGDVLGWNGASLTRVFDSAAAGVPAGTGCDAVARSGSELLISFDRTLAAGYAPADVVRWNGATFSLAFDGSAAGLPAQANVDAITVAADGVLWLSLDAGSSVAGITYADEDVLAWQPAGGTWSEVRRLSIDSVRWRAANLDALSVQFLTEIVYSNGFE